MQGETTIAPLETYKLEIPSITYINISDPAFGLFAGWFLGWFRLTSAGLL